MYLLILLGYQAGHVCGDDNDLIDGRPTGSVRVSFGPYSRQSDADRLLNMLTDCFVSKPAVYMVSIFDHFSSILQWLGKQSLSVDNKGLICNLGLKNLTKHSFLKPYYGILHILLVIHSDRKI